MKRLIPVILVSLFACQSNINKALKSVNNDDLAKDIATLAADSMLGRAPFTIGEKRTLAYLQSRMVDLGLKPAFGESYTQDVPMISITSKVPSTIKVNFASKAFVLKADDDYCAWSPTTSTTINIDNTNLIFAGFGITAPEYGWNDFDSIDVKGKIIVVLVNDPGFYTGDTALFKGNTMTYYGRWRYKFEEAERQGAIGCLIVHEDAPAGYPWAVAGNKNNTPQLYLDTPDLGSKQCLVNGWITYNAAIELFKSGGLDYETLKKQSTQKGFKAFNLNAKMSMNIENTYTKSASKNIAGMIKGTEKPDEVIVYSAHWDHLGVGRVVNGDSIYNGASDNAAAIAWMFSIAKAFKSTGVEPKRSVLFFSPTAEESGLYGSAYFVANPPIDINKTIACINNDVILFIGKFKDVTVTGLGHSSLDELLAEEATKFNRYIAPDPNPENGMFFRSDQLPFLKAGVPSMFAKGYSDQMELGKEKTQERIDSYWKNIYHKPQDEFVPERDNLDGLAEDVKLFFCFGNRLANENIYPQWKNSSEFYKER
ncbi:MAG: M28 family peptidase [Bacteroidales bacterium]|nr:M28 family peptidase [Bacteroidales bacterium]